MTDLMPVFNWKPEAEAAAWLRGIVDAFLDACPPAAQLAQRMRREAGVRFSDLVDFVEIPDSPDARRELERCGFSPRATRADGACFEHLGGLFPLLLLSSRRAARLGLKVESVSDFLAAHSITNDYVIEGAPLAPLRRVLAWRSDEAELWIVERHGSRDLVAEPVDPADCLRAMHHLESLRRRRRDWPDDELGWDRVDALVTAAVGELGSDRACDLFFAAERDYWQRRNRAARVQKARQDVLGFGWANHDHHTYRSSREHYHRLIRLLEMLGMRCRERFYAGGEAGWGAQVLEQPACGIVVFADVDMSAEEVAGDFAHEGLPQRDTYGTVGLWCALHGDSALQAGLHHLECQFDFDALRDQLGGAGIGTMTPFTDLPHLRQAFTEGERWTVSEERVARLVEQGALTAMQANQFLMQGAIGSHLENLQREDGYKGFNQKGVSDIIGRTDPRMATLRGA